MGTGAAGGLGVRQAYLKCYRMHPFTDIRYRSFISEEVRKLRIRKSAFRQNYVDLLTIVFAWCTTSSKSMSRFQK